MGLPWVRLDANIATHDKILGLLNDPSAQKWQAFSSYICSLAWSGGQGTDGYVPKNALQVLFGTAKTARLLEKYDLWEEAVGGWRIRNFEKRQQLSAVRSAHEEAKSRASQKANCVRHHGSSCWNGERCTKGDAA